MKTSDDNYYDNKSLEYSESLLPLYEIQEHIEYLKSFAPDKPTKHYIKKLKYYEEQLKQYDL